MTCAARIGLLSTQRDYYPDFLTPTPRTHCGRHRAVKGAGLPHSVRMLARLEPVAGCWGGPASCFLSLSRMRARETQGRPRRSPILSRPSERGLLRAVTRYETSARLQSLQPVVGCVLVRLAFGGRVEGAVDEVVDGPAVVEHRLTLVDKLGGVVAEDMHSK
jgi:hypothetical protein